jgi:NADH dehydrogenase FAD-containing subunit
MTNAKTVARILILGGGYAGVSTAVRLGQAGAGVVLVNIHSYHHLTTLLHQPAVGRRGYTEMSIALEDLLPSSVEPVRGRVTAICPSEKTVVVRTRQGPTELSFDYLVMALGWEPAFHDIPIAEVRDRAVAFADGDELPAGTVIWTGGVRANRLPQDVGFKVGRQDRAEVDQCLRPAGPPDAFISGEFITEFGGSPRKWPSSRAAIPGAGGLAHREPEVPGEAVIEPSTEGAARNSPGRGP